MATLLPKLRTGETGLEKFCTQCAEWWPADTEFFFSDPGGAAGLFYMCKACYAERYGKVRAARALAKYHADQTTPSQGVA